MLRRFFNWLSQYLQGNVEVEDFTGGCVSITQLKKEGVIEDKNHFTRPDPRPSCYGDTP